MGDSNIVEGVMLGGFMAQLFNATPAANSAQSQNVFLTVDNSIPLAISTCYLSSNLGPFAILG